MNQYVYIYNLRALKFKRNCHAGDFCCFKTCWTFSSFSLIQVHYGLLAHCAMSGIKTYQRGCALMEATLVDLKGDPRQPALLPYQHGSHISEFFARESDQVVCAFKRPSFERWVRPRHDLFSDVGPSELPASGMCSSGIFSYSKRYMSKGTCQKGNM